MRKALESTPNTNLTDTLATEQKNFDAQLKAQYDLEQKFNMMRMLDNLDNDI